MSTTALPLFNQPAGNNQYGNYGTGMPSYGTPFGISSVQSTGGVASGTTPPGIVPPTYAPPSNLNWGGYDVGANNPTSSDPAGKLGGIIDQPGTGANTESTLYPSFTQEYYNNLAGQIGTGVQPFDLSTLLPSSGQATAPGTVNAPLTQLLQQLQSFYSTGTGGPTGSSTLANLAATGNPINQTPAWQSMVASENQNTAQNEAQIREQFASLGNLNGSPFGTALTNFGEQNTLNQNSQLTQAQTAAQQQAVQNQLTASQALTSGANTLGTTLQGVDQSAIQNLIQQYDYSLPQNNPLNSAEATAAATFPPFFTSGSSGLLAGLIPSLTGAVAGGATSAASGGGLSSILLGALSGL